MHRLTVARTLAATATAMASAAAIAAFAAPAHAAATPALSSTGRSDACVSWGCGSATWTWGKTSIPTINMSVNDTACNDLGVGVQFGLRYTDGQAWAGPIHWSGRNCHEGYSQTPTLSYSGSKPIETAWVVIWQKGHGDPTGAAGNHVDNPYT
jgi:hypothetical protein